MSQVTLPVWSLCPFMSRTVAPKETKILGAPEPSPQMMLGNCLGPGCGLWKITKVVDGRPAEGICGIRFLGEVMNSVAGSLEQLVRRAEGEPALFGGKERGGSA